MLRFLFPKKPSIHKNGENLDKYKMGSGEQYDVSDGSESFDVDFDAAESTLSELDITQ